MAGDAGFHLGNSDMDMIADLYSFADNSELILSPSPTTKEPALTPESTAIELDWHFNEQFQELSTFSEVQPCAMINNDACPPATNSGADDVHSSEEISAMLAVAFDALDERFPSGLSSSLFPAPTSPATSAPQADEDVTDGLLADLLPTTITEVNEQSQAEELNKPATVSVVTKRKSRKRAVSSKRRAEVPKVPKLELDVSTLAVEQKANESKQQAIRRVKNNVASKVFRSKRKSKLENMLTQEANLDKENATLRRDLSLVTEVVSLLKEGLVSRCHARPSQIS